MALETKNLDLAYEGFKEGLIYDADSVVLAGKYSDELSAHRAKREWKNILNSYFLLDAERDYELWIRSDASHGYFVVHCCFTSACGRYAFWRLVNQQAPEAEAKLGESLRNNTIKRLMTLNRTNKLNRKGTNMLIDSIHAQIDENNRNKNLLSRLLDLFGD